MAALVERYEQNIKAAIALAILSTVLPACNQSANPEADTKISEIANGLNTDLIGKTVTVSGEA